MMQRREEEAGCLVVTGTVEDAKAELRRKAREQWDMELNEIEAACACGLVSIFPLVAFPAGNVRCYRCGALLIQYVRD